MYFTNRRVESMLYFRIENTPGPNNFGSFAPNFISDVCPNIKTLEVIALGQRESVKNFLTTKSQLSSIKIVKLYRGNPELLNLLLQAASNVEEFSLSSLDDFFC